MNKKIKAIIFDLGRVLVDYDMDEYYQKLKTFSDLSIKEVIKLLDYSDLSRQFVLGQISTKDFYKETAKRIRAKNLSYEKFKEIKKTILVSFNEEIKIVIKLIKPEIKLFILSNTDEFFWKLAEEFFVVKESFSNKDQKVLSFEIGLVKPDQKIFEEVVKRAGCSIKECLFIDDQEKNLKPFEALGGNVIQYNCQKNSISKLKNDLLKYNVFA